MKKVLLLTVSSGDSYTMTARALANGFATRYSSVSFKIVDIYKVNKSLELNFAGESTISEKLAHKIENDRYVKAKHTKSCEEKRKVINKYITVSNDYVQKVIKQYEPDVVICTHIFPAIIVNDMRQAQDMKFKSIFVSVDYATSPYLDLAKNLDMYIVNSKDMLKEYIKLGIPKEKCGMLGVPINSKFDHKVNKDELRDLLNIDNDNYTILLTNGTKKRDNNFKLFKAIVNKFKDVNLLVVCNKNAKLEYKVKTFVKANKLKNVKVYGHTNHMDMLIAVSDVVLGKTNGKEITQAMSQHIPYVATLKMRGQELDNMKFLKAHNLLINAKTIKSLLSRLEELKENKKLQKAYRNNLEKFYIPNAADEVVKLAFHMQKD